MACQSKRSKQFHELKHCQGMPMETIRKTTMEQKKLKQKDPKKLIKAVRRRIRNLYEVDHNLNEAPTPKKKSKRWI